MLEDVSWYRLSVFLGGCTFRHVERLKGVSVCFVVGFLGLLYLSYLGPFALAPLTLAHFTCSGDRHVVTKKVGTLQVFSEVAPLSSPNFRLSTR